MGIPPYSALSARHGRAGSRYDMATDKNMTRLIRREAVGMDELVEGFIREMKLASGLNRQRVMAAWKAVSGAEQYTLDVFFRDRVLYCTMSSSIARNQLYFQKDSILAQMNQYLENDGMFIKEGEPPYVKDIVLR